MTSKKPFINRRSPLVFRKKKPKTFGGFQGNGVNGNSGFRGQMRSVKPFLNRVGKERKYCLRKIVREISAIRGPHGVRVLFKQRKWESKTRRITLATKININLEYNTISKPQEVVIVIIS